MEVKLYELYERKNHLFSLEQIICNVDIKLEKGMDRVSEEKGSERLNHISFDTVPFPLAEK